MILLDQYHFETEKSKVESTLSVHINVANSEYFSREFFCVKCNESRLFNGKCENKRQIFEKVNSTEKVILK